MEVSVSDDGQLVRGCLAGNADSLREFVQRFQAAVFGLCFRMLSHREDAEDVSQEVFLRALRNLSQWDSARPLAPWLLTIAVNRCRTCLAQRVRRALPAEFAEMVADPAARPPRLDLAEELQLAVDRLREEYRLCFVLYHVNELSLVEIAEITGSPPGTIKTWLRRARQELADHLQRRSIVPQVSYDLR
ncbi:MAG: RNA polymerase sigma factor [Planctomycetia bacterium]|nr:RNA polymerase sigma factor [Planctomycetia bacterium]